MEKGYQVCIQHVGTALYNNPSFINLLKDVNELNPYTFYLVDTLGVMYRREMRKFFIKLIIICLKIYVLDFILIIICRCHLQMHRKQ